MKLRNPMVLRALTKPGPSQVISVTSLAEESEVSSGFVYHLLNERKQATPEVAGRIADVLTRRLNENLFVGRDDHEL